MIPVVTFITIGNNHIFRISEIRSVRFGIDKQSIRVGLASDFTPSESEIVVPFEYKTTAKKEFSRVVGLLMELRG